MPYTIASDYFQIRESNHSAELESLLALLEGRASAYHIREMIPRHMCESVSQSFASLHGSERADDVPGLHVGAFHYGKQTKEYFDEVATSYPLMSRLTSAGDPIAIVHDSFAAILAEAGISYRPANWAGQAAGRFVARSWTGSGAFALAPHEDAAQLRNPQQTDFEIQAVADHTVIGVNLCIRPSTYGGGLLVWDVSPDNQDRTALGLEYTGYPYPLTFVDSAKCLTLRASAGDLYCVNGNLLHAVEQQSGPNSRLTLSFICGFIDQRTVVYWT